MRKGVALLYNGASWYSVSMTDAEHSTTRLPRRHFTPSRFDERTGLFVGSPFSGHLLGSLARALAPEPTEARDLLLGLRRDFALSRNELASILGVSEVTLKSWELGTRSPSFGARRLAFLINELFRQERLTNLWELVTWKKCSPHPDTEQG